MILSKGIIADKELYRGCLTSLNHSMLEYVVLSKAAVRSSKHKYGQLQPTRHCNLDKSSFCAIVCPKLRLKLLGVIGNWRLSWTAIACLSSLPRKSRLEMCNYLFLQGQALAFVKTRVIARFQMGETESELWEALQVFVHESAPCRKTHFS